MSFSRLTADDFVVSSDAISATAWTTGNPALTSFYTASSQVGSSAGNYYVNVYDTAATSSIQFAIAYGNANGSGSQVYNSNVNGLSPSSTIFGQWQDLVIGDENTNFAFGAITSSEFTIKPLPLLAANNIFWPDLYGMIFTISLLSISIINFIDSPAPLPLAILSARMVKNLPLAAHIIILSVV